MLPQKRQSPRAVYSTGALTYGLYREQFATGQKAKEQHQFGAMLVEIINKKKFIPYQIVALNNGNFSFKDKEYKNGKNRKKTVPAMVLGDPHLAVIDNKAWKETLEQINLYRPREVNFGDIFDGQSINHHDEKNNIKRAHNYKEGKLNLKAEVLNVYNFLQNLSQQYPRMKINLTADNHSINIEKYVQNMKRLNMDIFNLEFAIQILNQLLLNKNLLPLEASLKALLEHNKLKPLRKNINFLHSDDIHKIQGWLLSEHGHKGINGSRGAPSSFEKNNIKAITQHTHSPKRTANNLVVGHLTDISQQDYAKGGLSTWLQANAVIYSDGTAMLLPLKNNFTKKKLS